MSKEEATPKVYAGSRAWCDKLSYEILQEYARVYYNREPKKDVKTSVRKYFGDKVFFILVGLMSSNISAWYDKNFDKGLKIETIGLDNRAIVIEKAREAIHEAKIIYEKDEMFGMRKVLRLIDNYEDILIDGDVIETVLTNNMELSKMEVYKRDLTPKV